MFPGGVLPILINIKVYIFSMQQILDSKNCDDETAHKNVKKKMVGSHVHQQATKTVQTGDGIWPTTDSYRLNTIRIILIANVFLCKFKCISFFNVAIIVIIIINFCFS